MTLETAGAIARSSRATFAVAWFALLLTGCGGEGNPLDNPPTVQNPTTTSGQKLSFIYFQKCVQPVFLKQLQINQNGVISTQHLRRRRLPRQRHRHWRRVPAAGQCAARRHVERRQHG